MFRESANVSYQPKRLSVHQIIGRFWYFLLWKQTQVVCLGSPFTESKLVLINGAQGKMFLNYRGFFCVEMFEEISLIPPPHTHTLCGDLSLLWCDFLCSPKLNEEVQKSHHTSLSNSTSKLNKAKGYKGGLQGAPEIIRQAGPQQTNFWRPGLVALMLQGTKSKGLNCTVPPQPCLSNSALLAHSRVTLRRSTQGWRISVQVNRLTWVCILIISFMSCNALWDRLNSSMHVSPH